MRIERIITKQTQVGQEKQFLFSPFFALRDTKRYTDREIHTKEEKTSQRERKWVNWSFYGVGLKKIKNLLGKIKKICSGVA